MEPIPVADLLWMGVRDARERRPLGSCLGELSMAKAVSGGAVAAADRDHLVVCASCRAELASLVLLLAGQTSASARAAGTLSGTRRRIAWASVAIAAAALVVVVIGDRSDRARGPVTRDPAGVDLAMPRVISPSGTTEAGTPFTWHAVPEASAYRVTIFDSTGAVVFEQRVLDTMLVLPDTSAISPGVTYDWQVEARTGWDRWTAAPMTGFRITPANPRSRSTLPPVPASPGATNLSSPIPTSDSALDTRVRAGTADARATYRRLLLTASRDSIALDRVVAADERTTGDPFLRHDLVRFRSWTPSQRATRLRTDSIRAAGVDAFGRDGARAAIAVWQEGVRLAAASRDSVAEGALRGNIGAALAREGMLPAARAELERARRLGEGVADWRVVANALSELAGLEEHAGSIARARALYADAIALRARTADRRGLASDHNNLALLFRSQGLTDQARRHLERARQANRALGRASAEATNLVNLAGLAIAAGETGRARDDLDDALDIWREAGDSAEMSSAWLGLAEVAVQRGEHGDAVAHLESALRVLVRAGPLPDELIARQRLASVLAGQGRMQLARDQWEAYRDRRTAAALPAEINALLDLGDGDLGVAFDLPAMAMVAYRRAISHYAALGHDEGLGAARHGLARVLVARGDTRDATRLFDEAHREQVARGDRRAAALTRIELGDLAVERSDLATARQHYTAAGDTLARVGDPIARARAVAGLARIDARSGRLDSAERQLLRAMEWLAARQAPDLAWRLNVQLADIRTARGNVTGARQALRSALATLDSVRAPIRIAADRADVRDDAARVYAQLAQLELTAGDVSAAFDASEGGRAREMAALLDRGKVETPLGAVGRMMEREQDLRFRLAAVERDTARSMSRAAAAVRAELADVRSALRGATPQYASLIDEQPVSWQQVAQRLRTGEVMLEYLVTDSATMVFVIRRDTISAVTLPIDARTLAARVTFARAALDAPDDERWATPMQELHRALIAPVEMQGLLRGASRLIVVPHATLHYLPFAALRSERGSASQAPRFLVERFVIQMAPSASAWAHDAPRRAEGGSGALALAPAPDALPASRSEVAAVSAGAGEAVRRLSGAAATEAAFRREAGSRRVVHLATFGALNRDNPLFSHLQLEAGGGHDGRLEVHEIFGLQLAADLVVLSACQTALASGQRAPTPAGDDVVGLARAFLAAGARHVVGSLWAVEDRATTELMTQFYRAGGADAPAEALAAAQRRLLAGNAMRHPWHWAGFVAIGGSSHTLRAIAPGRDVPPDRSSR